MLSGVAGMTGTEQQAQLFFLNRVWLNFSPCWPVNSPNIYILSSWDYSVSYYSWIKFNNFCGMN
jgi:hypothetical protein